MNQQTRPTILIVVLGLVVVFALGYIFYQSDKMEMPESYATATALLSSPTGETVGKVTFQESPKGVLIMAEARGLSPGGHALHIHPVGTCALEFFPSKSIFDPTSGEQGFVRVAPKDGKDPGDMPNIYAGMDGVARADFFTSGITMVQDEEHSVFDADGSIVVVHSSHDADGEEVLNTGEFVACGSIEPDKMKVSQM